VTPVGIVGGSVIKTAKVPDGPLLVCTWLVPVLVLPMTVD